MAVPAAQSRAGHPSGWHQLPTYCSVTLVVCVYQGVSKLLLASEEMVAHPTLSESSLYPTATKLQCDEIILGTETWFLLSLPPGCPHDSCLPCPPALYNQGSLSFRKLPWSSCVPLPFPHYQLPWAVTHGFSDLPWNQKTPSPNGLNMRLGLQELQEASPDHIESKYQGERCPGLEI